MTPPLGELVPDALLGPGGPLSCRLPGTSPRVRHRRPPAGPLLRRAYRPHPLPRVTRFPEDRESPVSCHPRPSLRALLLLLLLLESAPLPVLRARRIRLTLSVNCNLPVGDAGALPTAPPSQTVKSVCCGLVPTIMCLPTELSSHPESQPGPHVSRERVIDALRAKPKPRVTCSTVIWDARPVMTSPPLRLCYFPRGLWDNSGGHLRMASPASPEQGRKRRRDPALPPLCPRVECDSQEASPINAQLISRNSPSS